MLYFPNAERGEVFLDPKPFMTEGTVEVLVVSMDKETGHVSTVDSGLCKRIYAANEFSMFNRVEKIKIKEIKLAQFAELESGKYDALFETIRHSAVSDMTDVVLIAEGMLSGFGLNIPSIVLLSRKSGEKGELTIRLDIESGGLWSKAVSQ